MPRQSRLTLLQAALVLKKGYAATRGLVLRGEIKGGLDRGRLWLDAAAVRAFRRRELAEQRLEVS